MRNLPPSASVRNFSARLTDDDQVAIELYVMLIDALSKNGPARSPEQKAFSLANLILCVE